MTFDCTDLSRCQPPALSTGSCLQGKRAAMVTFSRYPADPRPRRAADALLKEGMSVDLICLGEENAPKREVLTESTSFASLSRTAVVASFHTLTTTLPSFSSRRVSWPCAHLNGAITWSTCITCRTFSW